MEYCGAKVTELSLEYRYMFVTDITNCYGSINPQSIDWALTFKGTKYENEDYLPVAKNIRMYLGALQNGRNIGIPQGSYIFDFVAEIILDMLICFFPRLLKRKESLMAMKLSAIEMIIVYFAMTMTGWREFHIHCNMCLKS